MDWGKQRNWRKWPWWLNLGAIVIHDDVTHYTAWMTRPWFKWYVWEVLQYPLQTWYHWTSIFLGFSKGRWPDSGSRVIMMLLWGLLAPCTWHNFFLNFIFTLLHFILFFWLRALIHKFLAGLNASVVALYWKVVWMFMYVCIIKIFFLVLHAALQWQFVPYFFNIPFICLLKVNVTVLFILCGEKISWWVLRWSSLLCCKY
jgi:hypothetical protein